MIARILSSLVTFLLLSKPVREFRSFSAGKELDVRDLIRWDGYPLEMHHVTTKDGYILELHRIPFGKNQAKNSPKFPPKKVVVLAHCMFCSSAAYVVLGPNGGLAYMLANSGYDVWMTNSRGNKYSRRHRYMSPEKMDFWKFSWNEMGSYDIPAILDYVTNYTESSKIDAVGYSMGAAQFFVALSENPEYNDKINNLVLMAPAIFLNNTRSRITSLSENTANLIIDTKLKLRDLEFAGAHYGLKHLLSKICIPMPVPNPLCERLFDACGMSGSPSYLDKRVIPFYFQFFPEATALRVPVHFYQNSRTGGFRKYSFGVEGNMRAYKSPVPPEYDLTKVRVRTHLLFSEGDHLTTAKDVKRLIPILPNLGTVYEIPLKKFTHFDYMWAKVAHKYVYKTVLSILNNKENKV